MSIVVSIDPGVHHCGVALWRYGVLDRAYYCSWKGLLSPTFMVFKYCNTLDDLVIEKMQVYRGRSVAKDLIDISLVSGEIAGAARTLYASRVTYYLPREWKHNLPKSVCHTRIRAKLTKEELAVISIPNDKRHATDVLDAIGIGLHFLGRK